MALAAIAELVDGHAMSNAGDDILQDAPPGLVEQHVVGDDGGDAHLRGQIGQLMQTKLIVRPPAQRECHIGAVAERFAQPAQPERAVVIRNVRNEDGDQAVAIGDEIGPGELAPGFAAALLAERQQPAETRIGGPIGRVDEDRVAVASDRAGSRPPGVRPWSWRLRRRARCRRASCDRRWPVPRSPSRPLWRTIPRRRTRPAGN